MDDQEPGSVVVERLPPAEAFGLLSHDLRLSILAALSDADGPLAFSTLRERAGVRDAGQFNYHLGKLVGLLVRDTDDGYELTVPGERVVGGVLSGRYTQVVDADPVPVDADCLNCGAAVAVQFEDGVVRVGCDDCDFDVTELDLPAGALADYDRPDVPAVVARWLGRARRTLDDGFCPTCDGRLDNRVRFSTHDDAPEWLREDEVAVRHDCGRCEFRA